MRRINYPEIDMLAAFARLTMHAGRQPKHEPAA